MFANYYRNEEKTDRERYLERQLEEYRREDERRTEEESERRYQRRQEIHERAEEVLRDASTWEVAISNSLVLLRREAEYEAEALRELDMTQEEYNLKHGAPWFERTTKLTERMQEIYKEESAAAESEIKALEAQIEAVRMKVLERTADRLEPEIDDDNQYLVNALRENEPEVLVNW